MRRVRSAPQPAMEWLLFLIFLGVALLMLVIAAATGFDAYRAAAREQRAAGFVTNMVVRVDDEGDEFYYPVVTFTHPDGTRYVVETSVGSRPPAHTIDDAVTVLYDPEHPSSARIDSLEGGIGHWIVTFVTGFLAIMFSLAAWMAYPYNSLFANSAARRAR